MRNLIFAWSLALGVLATSALANPRFDCVDYYTEGRYGLAIAPCTIMAEQGEAIFQYILGRMYYEGLGVAQNYEDALQWYKRGAEQGGTGAQIRLGFMYWHGIGVVQNYSEAQRWYHAAAEQGAANAQNALGVMYQYGQGLAQNYVLAHMWYNISASHNAYEIAVSNRNHVAALMTPQQIAEAQTRAQRCLDSNYADC